MKRLIIRMLEVLCAAGLILKERWRLVLVAHEMLTDLVIWWQGSKSNLDS